MYTTENNSAIPSERKHSFYTKIKIRGRAFLMFTNNADEYLGIRSSSNCHKHLSIQKVSLSTTTGKYCSIWYKVLRSLSGLMPSEHRADVSLSWPTRTFWGTKWIAFTRLCKYSTTKTRSQLTQSNSTAAINWGWLKYKHKGKRAAGDLSNMLYAWQK